MKKRIKNINIRKIYNTIKKEYLLSVFFVLSCLVNATLLRIATVKNILNLTPLLIDLAFLLFVVALSFLVKRKKRIKYFMIWSIFLTAICIVNTLYYTYYSSFASVSLLATSVFVADVGDAIVENVLKYKDFMFLWQPIFLLLVQRQLNKRNYYQKPVVENKKRAMKLVSLNAVLLIAIACLFIPIAGWGKFSKLWNRESVVMDYGIYVYQVNDLVQSLKPQLNNLFGHDNAYKKVTTYYDENPYEAKTNEYSNIFEGKNVIVIHAESMQAIAMDLAFNGKEVTPNLNKLAEEGMFFSNFYSQVGVGTSSDAEFTFNTSLMPSSSGTVFVNYFDHEYITIPKLLNEKGYYTFSMHANTGDFWNRNIMHKNMGYNMFYHKSYYNIDETIGFSGTGLSDKSFFRQSVDIIKGIKEEHQKPFYSTLITLTNHTPFSDTVLMDEYPTTITVNIGGNKVTRDYINGTTLGNYFRSVHYADQAIGDFINGLEQEGLLDNTVVVIYGDHDARLSKKEYNILYNYDPITDRVLTEGDANYKEYNDYVYELDRRVPFIIWTKEKQFNLNITTPMGMIDVLPTLGNMLNIHSDYQLGTDIFNVKENTIVFSDSSYLTDKIYYNAPKGEIYPISKEAVGEEYINIRNKHANTIIELSNDIISFDLIREIKTKTAQK